MPVMSGSILQFLLFIVLVLFFVSYFLFSPLTSRFNAIFSWQSMLMLSYIFKKHSVLVLGQSLKTMSTNDDCIKRNLYEEWRAYQIGLWIIIFQAPNGYIQAVKAQNMYSWRINLSEPIYSLTVTNNKKKISSNWNLECDAIDLKRCFLFGWNWIIYYRI